MKIAFFGNFGVRNLGDDLILRGIMEQWKGHELMVFCGNPERVWNDFGLEAHHFFPGGFRTMLRSVTNAEYRRRIRSGFQALSGADKIIIGGGGILVDRHPKAVFLWWQQLKAIARSGKPYEFAANSFELNRPWSRTLFDSYLRKAENISVRDSDSQRFIQSLGLEADLVPDLGLTTIAKRTARPSKKIGLALCAWGLDETKLEILRNFIQQRRQVGYEIVGLAFQTSGDDDRKIFQKLDPTLSVVTGLENILKELQGCQLLIGMRFHSLLIALYFDIPVIALAYQQKVASLMEDRGLSDQCIPIHNLDERNVQELFQKMIRGL